MSGRPEVQPGYVRRYLSAEGGCVDVHDTHGKQEIRQNLPIAVFLADRGEHVCLLPVINRQGIKSADATRNGQEWEFKNPASQSANAIDKALRSANKQAVRVLILLPANFNRHLLEQAIHSRVRRAANIVEVVVLLANSLHHFSRREIINDTFRGKMG